MDEEKSKKLFNILAKQGNLSTEVAKFEPTAVSDGRDKPRPKTLLKMAMSVYTRVHALKKVRQLIPKKSLFKPLQCKKSLLNIKKSYLVMLKRPVTMKQLKTFFNI